MLGGRSGGRGGAPEESHLAKSVRPAGARPAPRPRPARHPAVLPGAALPRPIRFSGLRPCGRARAPAASHAGSEAHRCARCHCCGRGRKAAAAGLYLVLGALAQSTLMMSGFMMGRRALGVGG